MVIAMRMGQYAPMLPRTALVTGGASGIGAAIVDLLREEGAEVQALDLAAGFDVSDPQAWETVDAVELACLNAGTT
jgi:NAD(P)-dependent dehydrogenase (short-subunit alcohol dehydrogenase family)